MKLMKPGPASESSIPLRVEASRSEGGIDQALAQLPGDCAETLGVAEHADWLGSAEPGIAGRTPASKSGRSPRLHERTA